MRTLCLPVLSVLLFLLLTTGPCNMAALPHYPGSDPGMDTLPQYPGSDPGMDTLPQGLRRHTPPEGPMMRTLPPGPGVDPGMHILPQGPGMDNLPQGARKDSWMCTLPQGPGPDTLPQGPGTDTLPQGPGTDTLPQGPGMDTLPQGPGMDNLPQGPKMSTLAPAIRVDSRGHTLPQGPRTDSGMGTLPQGPETHMEERVEGRGILELDADVLMTETPTGLTEHSVKTDTSQQILHVYRRDVRHKEKFLKHLTGPLYFNPKCRKQFYRLYHNTRDCTIPVYYKRCARMLTRLASSPRCAER